uniref:Integrase core domain containing protein n=1 Tax=Solanum tuberosum TaxID=4113 RepID=M1DXS0_SOLTU
MWNVFEKCGLAIQESSRRLTEEVGEHELDRHWTHQNFMWESVKLGGPMDESVGPIFSAVWTPKLTGGLVKLGEGGKGKGKSPVAEKSENNSSSDGESFDSKVTLFELEDDQPLQSQRAKISAKEICQQAGVPHYEKTDIEVTPTSFTDIRRIEFEYTWGEEDRERAAPVDAFPEVDVESIPAKASLPTPASESSGTPASTPF